MVLYVKQKSMPDVVLHAKQISKILCHDVSYI
ncbi:hypothetical protein F383_38068 [Gossypium arboreum]|uniref:Uncharacterized protein n=1 Tax=Gossypium arboreum TaxID=29729 RepID=A0A0B0M9V7_GOSAR|nr:hypothetical protein F383_38068 [Gossypium arboreum]